MKQCKYGNPKRKSRFICLKCMKENQMGGIQRINYQREKGHIKNLTCIKCNEVTKNLEIRYCDWLEEMMDKAFEIRGEYYNELCYND